MNDYKVDTRGYKAGGTDVSSTKAASVYSEPSPSAEVIFKLSDHQIVTVLSEPNADDINWGWRQVSIQTNGAPVIGWVRNRVLLDNCEGNPGGLGCLPIQRFTKTFGFGPNNFAKRECTNKSSGCYYLNTRGLHNGLDFSSAGSTPLIWAGGGIGTLRLYHGDADPAFEVEYNGLSFIYGHSDPIEASDKFNWKEIRPGQIIGFTDSENNHLHFSVRGPGRGDFYNPIHYFSRSIQTQILKAMRDDGGYSDNYTAFSMISFDNSTKYSGNANYYFWTGCDRWAGIVMEDAFWDPDGRMR